MKIFIIGMTEDGSLKQFHSSREADYESEEWCLVASTSLKLAFDTYDLAFQEWWAGEDRKHTKTELIVFSDNPNFKPAVLNYYPDSYSDSYKAQDGMIHVDDLFIHNIADYFYLSTCDEQTIVHLGRCYELPDCLKQYIRSESHLIRLRVMGWV